MNTRGVFRHFRHGLIALIAMNTSAFGQVNAINDTVKSEALHFFCEGYIGRSTNEAIGMQENFLYNHTRLNSPGINFTSIQYSFEKKQWGFDVGLQDGRYVQANYSSQPKINALISQAKVHYQPFQKLNFIVQGGIFPSHIGFESAWNTDNLTLTRSMLAENSPYYESGLSAEWISPTEKWGLKALCLSGWQQSQWKWPVQHPSWGWASYWMPSTHWKLAYNGFWGHLDNRSSETYQYHNFYLQGKWKSMEWIAGYDFGIKDKKNRWNSPVLILAKSWNERFKSAARWEKMTDPNTVILLNGDEKLTARNAVSMNLDWKINSSFTARIEYKYAWAQKESKTTHRDLITCNVIFQARWERLTMRLNNQEWN